VTEREESRLAGHLAVLLAVRDELEAIGAPPARFTANAHAIAATRARLADLGGSRGDLTDATPARDS
jgi:hypothetical protein